MKSIHITIISLLFSFSAISQEIDVLINATKTQIKDEASPEKKSKLYGDLSWYYVTISVDSSYKYGHKSLELAKEVKNDTLIAQAYNDLATVYYLKGDYQTSQEYCRNSYAIRKLQNDYKGLASLDVKMANNFNRMTQYDSSMFYYLKAHKYFVEDKNIVEQMNIESNISSVYFLMGNDEKAIEYLEKPIEYFEKTDDYLRLSNSIANLGNIYLRAGDTLKAIESFQKAEKSALNIKNYSTLGVIYNNLGEIYSNKGDYQKAIDYTLKSIEVRETGGYNTDLASSFLSLSLNYFRMGNYPKAKPYLLKVAKTFEDSNKLDKLSETYLLLSHVYVNQGNTDSVNYYTNKFHESRFKLTKEQIINSTQELDAKYQTEKKEKELLESQTVIKEKNMLIYGTSILAVVLAILGYLLFNQQKLKNQQLQKETQLKDALHQIATQNKLQEQRLYISRDLHDNIGAQLTFIISTLDNIKYALKEKNEKITTKLQGISSFTLNTIYELRDTIWAMNKTDISFEDLKSRISNYMSNAQEFTENINFSFSVEENIMRKYHFTSVQGMNLYRIIQESVNNSLKYAEANQIKVEILETETQLLVNVTDNGKGFDSSKVETNNGLINMQKRAKEIQAGFSLKSKINQGTTVQLALNKDHFLPKKIAS